MDVLTVSPKFQVVIPKEIREAIELRPGQKIGMVQMGKQIILTPLEDIRKLRGFAGKMRLNDVRDHSERF